MPLHPADGPRLSTLYVPHSTRKRRRRTHSRRRRRNAAIAGVTVVVVAAAGFLLRDKLTPRVHQVLFRRHPAMLVRDVTSPTATPTATVRQAGAPIGAPRPVSVAH